MANDVRVNINVTDNGSTAKVNAVALKLKKTFEGVQAAARIPMATQAAKAGVANAAYAPGASDTNLSRGIGGQTGASGRDFAAQAQGLGGLVHVYATFAANLFAVSAAFTALSNSMDTTNLVKGLDQIGASSGRNLGSLAKQMVSVADGAISLRDAMTSTAMASSGGMNNSAILRMTEVAKKASLALGRDLPDSMERLTKGIVKTQPELLDELGIMTRMIPAQQEYARQIGKTMSSLTDFEKRQAFANAVLDEGERKFGAIALTANPYSKILASTGNLLQSGLEVINKVLGPLMSLLASSPTGLAVALGGIATLLLKQAIPAIGMFRENAKRMYDETHARVVNQVKEQQATALRMDEIVTEAAKKEYQTASSTAAKIAKLQASRFNTDLVGKDERKLLRKSTFDLTADDIQALRNREEILSASLNSIEKKQGAKLNKWLADVDIMHKASLDAGHAAAEANIAADDKWYAHQSLLARNLAKLNLQAAKSRVLANVADNAATVGPSYAFQQLREEANKLDASKFTKFSTVVKGSLTIATNAVGTFLNAFSTWGQLIGIVGLGIGLLDSYLTTSAKESAAYSIAIDTLNASLENADRTLEVISKKDTSNFLSVESTQAKANAMDDLSSSLASATDKFKKLLQTQSWFDQELDNMWEILGKGITSKLSIGISNSIVDTFKLLEEGPAKKKAKESLEAILGQSIDTTNLKSITQTLSKLDEVDLAKVGSEIAAVTAKASREFNNGAAALTGFKTALADVLKQSTTMSNSILPKDDFSKMGIELAKAANTLNIALKDPLHSLIALRELAGDLKAMSFLPPDTALKLSQAKVEMDKLSAAISISEKEVENAELRVKEAQSKVIGKPSTFGNVSNAEKTLKIEKESLSLSRSRLTAETSRLESIKAQFKSIPELFSREAFDLLAKGLKFAMLDASVIAANGYLSVLKQGGVDTAKAEASIKQREFSTQTELINSNFNIVFSNEKLAIAIETASATQERANLLEEAKTARGSKADLISEKLITNQARLEATSGRQAILNKKPEELLSLYRNKNSSSVSTEDLKSLDSMAGYVQAVIGKESQLAKVRAGSYAARLDGEVKIGLEANARDAQRISNSLRSNSMEKLNLEMQQSKLGIIDEELILKKQANSDSYFSLTLEEKLNKLNEKSIALEVALNNAKSYSQVIDIYAAKQRLEIEKNLTKEENKLSKTKADRDIVELNNLARIDKLYKELAETRDNVLSKQEDSIAIDAANIELKNSMLFLSIAQTAEETKLATIKVAEHKRDVAYYNLAIKYSQDLNKVLASTDTEDNKKKRQEELMTSYTLGIDTVKNGFDKDVTIAGIESAKTIGSEWESTAKSITSELTDAFITSIDSAESLFVNLRNSVTSMFKNMVLRPTIQGALNSMVGGTVGAAGSSATGGLIGGLTGSSLTAIGSQIGSAASVSMSNGLVSGFGANMANIAGQIEAGSWAAAFGMAVPYVAAAAAIYSILSQDHGTPTQSTGNARIGYGVSGNQTSYETFFGGSNKDTDKAVANLQAAYMAGAKSLGISTVAASFGYGGNTGKDNANPNFAITAGAGSQWYSSGETALTDEAVKLASSRAVFAALQGSELPKYLVGVFDGIVASTATQDQITAVLDTAQAFKTLHDQLLNLPFKNFKDLSYEATKGLVEAAGGLDKLSSSLDTYYTNFYSAEEQRAQTISNINRALAGSGFDAATATKDQFRALVESQNVTTASGQALYTTLLAVSGAFSSLFDTTTKLNTAEELRKAQLDQEIKIYQLLGEESKALTLSRTEELKLLDERLRPAQLYIYALEDEATLKDKLKTAYDKVSGAIKTTITGLQTSIKTLKDYKSALAQGNNSILTPYQKYLQAKQTAYDTSLVASSTGTSAQEVAARNDAISKLPTVAGTFLDASRTLFASGAQYTADYSMVSKYISELGASLDTQLTDAQKQLDALDTSVSFLTSIDTTLADVYSLLEQYTQATVNTAGARGAAGAAGSTASGGVVSGKGGWTGTLAEINTLIRDNIVANPQNVYDAVIRQGFSAALISEATRTPSANILAWAASYGGGIPAFANGGLANGLAMVGEHGPELVNFRNPGRVYSNRASNDMLNNAELVQEIKNLRQELNQLRQEQKEQTGHLITANYDANIRAANKVVGATEAAVSDANWSERSKVKVA